MSYILYTDGIHGEYETIDEAVKIAHELVEDCLSGYDYVGDKAVVLRGQTQIKTSDVRRKSGFEPVVDDRIAGYIARDTLYYLLAAYAIRITDKETDEEVLMIDRV
jgi:hypothetical protein